MSTEVSEEAQRTQGRRAAFDPQAVVVAQPSDFPQELNALSGRIIGAAMEVHTHLGPGMREKIYEVALIHELRQMRLRVGQQVPFVALYKGAELPTQVVDTVVENSILLEVKAVRAVTEEDHGQLTGYLKLTGLPLGLMLNFGRAHLRDGIHRKINFPPQMSPALSLKSSFLSVPPVSPP